VDGLTPMQYFLAGIAVAAVPLALFLFFAKRSVAERRKQFPDASRVLEKTQPKDQPGRTFEQRLEEIEKRLSKLEDQKRE
jgi:hypothetical protein